MAVDALIFGNPKMFGCMHESHSELSSSCLNPRCSECSLLLSRPSSRNPLELRQRSFVIQAEKTFSASLRKRNRTLDAHARRPPPFLPRPNCTRAFSSLAVRGCLVRNISPAKSCTNLSWSAIEGPQLIEWCYELHCVSQTWSIPHL